MTSPTDPGVRPLVLSMAAQDAEMMLSAAQDVIEHSLRRAAGL
jgi:hypothetical protein